MIYKEKYIATVNTISELTEILSKLSPDAFMMIENSAYLECSVNIEVWYDKDSNTVILK